MNRLGDVAVKVRSKNAGPFWLTVDIFCGSSEVFSRVSGGVRTSDLAELFRIDPSQIKRFEMADLKVVKFSLPRPAVQGTVTDCDMHGASFAQIVSDIEI